MDTIGKPFAGCFACVRPRDGRDLTLLGRHIRDLTSERPAAAELARIRGLRVYAEITADNKRLDAEAPR